MERVAFESRGRITLAGILHRPPLWRAGGPAAVVCHGMLSTKDSPKHEAIAAALSQRGVLSLRFDFAGRGQSGGDMVRDLTVSGEVEDLRAAVSLLRSLGASSVSLAGSSLGGTVVALLAGRDGGIRAIACIAAVARPGALFGRMLGSERMDAWRRTGILHLEQGDLGYGFHEDAAGQDVLSAAARIACPALFVHGALDDVVPLQSSRDLGAAVAGESDLVVIEGADHPISLPAHRELAARLVAGWLSC
jgi:pimeloyl-ACP methyl ester carboxylesterase